MDRGERQTERERERGGGGGGYVYPLTIKLVDGHSVFCMADRPVNPELQARESLTMD